MLRKPRPADGILVEEIGSELCLMRVDTHDVLVLNQSASDIWLLIDGKTDSTRLTEMLASFYELSVHEITPHVQATLEEFESRGFVVAHEHPA